MALEADRGFECDPYMVVGPILEVDLIAHIGAQPKRTDKAFQTDARKGCRTGVSGSHVVDCGLKTRSCVLVGKR